MPQALTTGYDELQTTRARIDWSWIWKLRSDGSSRTPMTASLRKRDLSYAIDVVWWHWRLQGTKSMSFVVLMLFVSGIWRKHEVEARVVSRCGVDFAKKPMPE
jgi:hypothetical protein